MPNMHDYLEWRGDIPLSVMPLCDIDNLILATLSFLNFDGIVSPSHGEEKRTLSDVSRAFFADPKKANESYGFIFPTKDFMRLLSSAAATERFGNIGVSAYVNRVDREGVEQFSAVTFTLPDESIYVAFKGTDDNIVAWKEDFLLSYTFPVKAQRSALSYLEAAAEGSRGKIYIGGHSKGGNLAFYSAAYSSAGVKERIARVWSNDGPGFYKRTVGGEEYRSIKDKLVTVMPEDSVIGRLFDNEASEEIIMKAEGKGLLQHDPFSWQIKGGDFVRAEKFTDDSTVIRRAFRKYLSEIDAKGREDFVLAFFTLLENAGAKTLTDIIKDGFISLPSSVKTLSELTKDQRDMLRSFVTFLASLPVK